MAELQLRCQQCGGKFDGLTSLSGAEGQVSLVEFAKDFGWRSVGDAFVCSEGCGDALGSAMCFDTEAVARKSPGGRSPGAR